MEQKHLEQINLCSEEYRGSKTKFFTESGFQLEGHLFMRKTDAITGQVIEEWDNKNLIVFDAGILLAWLCKDPAGPAHGINMLSVGTGATGSLLSPDAPTKTQRKLNTEIARKAVTVNFVDSTGAAVAYPTHILDVACTFGVGEAVGPWNEMALLSTVSANPTILNPNTNGGSPTYDPTVDVTAFDIEVNYLTFPVSSKLTNEIVTLVWRLIF